MGSVDFKQDTIDLPVIDISNPTKETGQRLVEAAIKYGFLYVSPKGTPFTEELVNHEFELSKQFFSSPDDQKGACRIGGDNHGWTGMHNEILDPANQRKGDFKEAFNFGEFTPDGKPQQKMPPCLSSQQTLSELYEFESACRSTCHRILDLIGVGLEIESADSDIWFSQRHSQPSGSTVRLLHYPAIPADTEYEPEVDVRAGAHSDYGSITLLFQRPSQPGLEIRPPGDNNKWSPVAVFPPRYPSTTLPPILVNIADLMSYWTNGLLRSTVHRVIFPKDTVGGKDRYSIAYFCHPSNDTELVPVPSKMVNDHRLKLEREKKMLDHGYGGGATNEKPITAREHLINRLNATYTHTMKNEVTAK